MFMVFIGNGLLYGMRINVSVAMAAMTNATYTTVDHDGSDNQTVETCPRPNISAESTNEVRASFRLLKKNHHQRCDDE